MAWIAALRGGIALIAIFTLPGWVILTFAEAWQDWPGLQRWIVATGLSIAFYPILFYWARLVPFLTLGPYKMALLLVICALVAALRLRKHWRSVLKLTNIQWLAIGIIGMTLFTRFWMVRDLPYPAWSDSLHHALLTHLTAVQGRLPATMEPYFPVVLEEYHLGLYSISATLEWLAQVPAHTALLWTAQALNGLCGIGVYLVLDRKVGPVAALVGASVVGLLCHQPAFYVNWGRFTQLSAQVILPIAWLVAWEAIALWKGAWPGRRSALIWRTVIAAALSAAVFLLHFRVAVFYLPLLGITLAWELFKARGGNGLRGLVWGAFLLGGVSVLLVAPAAWGALRSFVAQQATAAEVSSVTARVVRQEYYEFPWSSVPILAAREWLLIAAGLCGVFALLRRDRLVSLTLLWVVSLLLMANTYRLGIAFPNLTNLGAVLIMMYLPIGITSGAAVQDALHLFSKGRSQAVSSVIVALMLLAGFVASHFQVLNIEPHRYFVTDEDVAAMEWIRGNTDADALFAINTYFWMPHHPHGTDAGYWIPYFTGRKITAAVMLLSLATPEYQARVVQLSQAEERLAMDGSSLAELRSLGVDYIYIGAKGDFSGPGLNAAQLREAPNVTVVYQTSHVSILKI